MSTSVPRTAAETCQECLSASDPRCTIVCLANSRKHGRHCIAGICRRTGSWVRPISDLTDDGSLFEGAITIQGKQPEPLQVLAFPFRTLHAPTFEFQPENRVVDRKAWRMVGQASVQEVLRFCEGARFILHNDGDRVPLSHLRALPASQRKSLQLVHCTEVSFYTKTSRKGNPQCRARFRWHDIAYDLAVTDPEFERRFPACETAGRDCVLTVSLGMPFDPENSGAPACYKLIAGIIGV